jgi:hypothetical protein
MNNYDNVDQWWSRMEEHKRKGHTIISYGDRTLPSTTPGGNRPARMNEQTLLMQTERIKYWTRYHAVPTQEELLWGKQEAAA